MKRIQQLLFFPFLLMLLVILCACGVSDPFSGTPPEDTSLSTDNAARDALIQELENKIIELQQNQYISEAEYQKELKKLQSLLSELQNQISAPSTDTSPDSSNPPSDTSEESMPSDTTTPIAQFLYKKEGDGIIITGYTGSESHIVIPAKIDGYQVTTVGDSAFSSQTLKSIIISNGIQKIDWFAFNGCTALLSVTIPESVTSIGYSAFSPQSNAFTIYCHNDSFAHRYAKSYGWSYAII